MAWEMKEGYTAPTEETVAPTEETVAPKEEPIFDSTQEPEYKVEGIGVDRFDSTEDGEEVYQPPINEEDEHTMTPAEIEYREQESLLEDAGALEEEIKQVYTTTADQLDLTETGQAKIAAYRKKLDSVLENKYGVRKEDIKMADGSTQTMLVVIDPKPGQRRMYPYTSTGLDAFKATWQKDVGAVGGAIAAGKVASKLPIPHPVGRAIAIGGASILGGFAGAKAGDHLQQTTNAAKHDIEITEAMNEGRDLQLLGEEIVAAVGGVALVKIAGRILSPLGQRAYKSLDAMPKKYRKAIQVLQDKTGISDEAMEKVIKNYGKSTESGQLSLEQAVKGAAQSSHEDQLGILLHAIKDPKVKAKFLNEMTERSNQMYNIIKGNKELRKIYKANTSSDKNRFATNWKGLYEAFKEKGLNVDSPIMKEIEQNAKTFADYEQKIFKGNVNAVKVDPAGIRVPLLKHIYNENSSRSTIKAEEGATLVRTIKSIVSTALPQSNDRQVAEIITDAIKNGTLDVKKLKVNLEGMGLKEETVATIVGKVNKAGMGNHPAPKADAEPVPRGTSGGPEGYPTAKEDVVEESTEFVKQTPSETKSAKQQYTIKQQERQAKLDEAKAKELKQKELDEANYKAKSKSAKERKAKAEADKKAKLAEAKAKEVKQKELSEANYKAKSKAVKEKKLKEEAEKKAKLDEAKVKEAKQQKLDEANYKVKSQQAKEKKTKAEQELLDKADLDILDHKVKEKLDKEVAQDLAKQKRVDKAHSDKVDKIAYKARQYDLKKEAEVLEAEAKEVAKMETNAKKAEAKVALKEKTEAHVEKLLKVKKASKSKEDKAIIDEEIKKVRSRAVGKLKPRAKGEQGIDITPPKQTTMDFGESKIASAGLDTIEEPLKPIKGVATTKEIKKNRDIIKSKETTKEDKINAHRFLRGVSTSNAFKDKGQIATDYMHWSQDATRVDSSTSFGKYLIEKADKFRDKVPEIIEYYRLNGKNGKVPDEVQTKFKIGE